MTSIPPTHLRQLNPLIRRDYTLDYTGSDVPASLSLSLLSATDREVAFESIRTELAVSRDTLLDIYTSIVDGKHILLYGPPGTGKTTLADMIAERMFNCSSHRETAVADWTPFETIGGLQLETTLEGRERLAPQPGVITRQVVQCLNTVGSYELDGTGRQGAWLILDELNRANMDAAFGQFFTALDQDHPQVPLPFFDSLRQALWVPKRFRIIGTMNTFDKNFLFRLSYALTRRFALIAVDVPANSDTAARTHEKEQLWKDLAKSLQLRGVRTVVPPVSDLMAAYDTSLMQPLYESLVSKIRAPQVEGAGSLGRGLGFAQIAAALRHAVLELELGLVAAGAEIDALDRGIRSAIVPQLEGLPTTLLKEFVTWWEGQTALRDTTRSIMAVKELLRGASLYRTE